MNDKLKNRILRLVNRLLASLMIGVGMACCGSLAVYGVDEGLTEEEVKQQVLEIIEAEAEEKITDYTIVEYDIEKIYPIISLDFFVNDYIDGMTFEEIIEKQKKEYKELNGEDNQYTYWHLPYNNYLEQKCMAVFLSDDENLEIVYRTIDNENDYDMKLYEGKYEEIVLEKIQNIIYLNMELYGFMIVYICKNDCTEYVIPYLDTRVEKLTALKSEKIYSLDDFVTSVYNCYDEPKTRQNKSEKTNLSSLVSTRKRKLNCKTFEQIKKIEWIKENILIIVVVLIFFAVSTYMIVRRHKKVQTRSV